MTVAELIEKLKAMPPEARVIIPREGYPISDEELDPNDPAVNEYGQVEL